MNRVLVDRRIDYPYLIVKYQEIIYASSSFTALTGYADFDVVGSNITNVFELLKLQVNIDAIDYNKEYFLYTKSTELRIVTIKAVHGKSNNEYSLIINEKQDSKFHDKLQFFGKLMLDNNLGMAIISLPDFILLKANAKHLDILKVLPEEFKPILGTSIISKLKALFGLSTQDIFDELIEKKETKYLYEIQIDTLEGKQKYYDCILTPIEEETKVKYIVSMFIDLTDRIQNSQGSETYVNNDQLGMVEFEAAFNSLNVGVLIFKDGKIFTQNQAFTDCLFGHKLTECDGTSSPIQFNNEKGESVSFKTSVIDKVLRGEHVLNCKIAFVCDGVEKFLIASGNPISTAGGNGDMHIISLSDATADAKNYLEQEQHKKQLEAVFDSITQFLAFVDCEGNVLKFNSIFKAKHDKKEYEIIFDEFYKPDMFFDENGVEIPPDEMPVKKVARGEKVEQYRFSIKFPDGQLKHFCSNGTPVFDNKGKFQIGVFYSWEITDHIKYQKILHTQQEIELKAEKKEIEFLKRSIQEKETFFSYMSHEFKTPLTVINSAIQVLESVYGSEFSDRSGKYLKRIRQNAFRLLRLINNLLDINRAEAGYMNLFLEYADVVMITRNLVDSVSVYARQKNITVHFNSSLKNKVIALDVGKYERILLNLLSNAIKFTPEGKSVYISLSRQKQNICINIRDEGIGIPKDKKSIIFNYFGQVNNELTRPSEGAGIGLALVKQLVQAMHGDIYVKSKEGEGSKFTVVLPENEIKNATAPKKSAIIQDNRLIQSVQIEFSHIYI